jgi:hypothetical protein
MALPTTALTRFPGGVGQFVFFVVGGAAGDLTATGIKATDNLLFVQAIEHDTDGDISAITDITSRCTLAADKVVLAAGDSTADMLLAVTFTRPVA